MSDEPLSTGRIIAGRYALTQQLGAGGSTWAALDQQYNVAVALREVVAPHSAGPDEQQAVATRAVWEAGQLAQLREDPNVVTVYGTVEEEGRLWIVMELLNGQDLGRLVAASGPLPAPEVGLVAVAVLGALASAHALGVTHREVKPGNIIRCLDGRVVLTGFGSTGSFPAPAALDFTDPERVRSGQATFGGDVFSLGATLYYLVEGAAPFARPDPPAQAAATQTEEPPQPMRAGPLGPALFALLRKNAAELPAPAVARAQIAAVLGLGQATGVVQAVSPVQDALAQTGSTQTGLIQSGLFQNGPLPTGPAGLPADAARPPAVKRVLWLLAALASAVSALAVFMTSWGSIAFPNPGEGPHEFSLSLFDLIKNGTGGISTDPAPAVVGWLAPLLLPLLATVVIGVVAAVSSKRLGWLCMGSALVGVGAQVGTYLWIADIPAFATFSQPSVSLHLWGYVGAIAAVVSLVFAISASVAGRTASAPVAAPAAPTPVAALKRALKIGVAVGAALVAGAVFLPFASYKEPKVNINALQWSQITIVPETVCLVALIVFALLALSPRRPAPTSRLVIPAAAVLGLQVLMSVQFFGILAVFETQYRPSLALGSWVGIGLALVVVVLSILSHQKAGYGGQPVGVAPGYAGYANAPQPGYPQQQWQMPSAQATGPQPEYPPSPYQQ